MSFSLNKVMLIGNLGKDAEVRFTTNNISVTTFNLAVTRSFKKDDKWQNEVTWFYVVAYDISDYYKSMLKKGKKFYVEGRISFREYTDKHGVKKNVTEIISEKLIPLDSSSKEQTEISEPEQEVNNVVEDNQVQAESDDLPF